MTHRECLLGFSHELDRDCAIQGSFDVWVTWEDKILISDIGSPSPEPKRSIALGVDKRVADEVAEFIARKDSLKIVTTQQTCTLCGKLYWLTEHEASVARLGRRRFCPACILKAEGSGGGTFDVPDYWCG